MKPEAPVTHTVSPAISYFKNHLSCLPDRSTTKKEKSVAPIENLCAINKQSLLQKDLCNTNKQICTPKKPRIFSCKAPCRTILHIDQKLVGFQRQYFTISSKLRKKRVATLSEAKLKSFHLLCTSMWCACFLRTVLKIQKS
jgi:hypothetical protein